MLAGLAILLTMLSSADTVRDIVAGPFRVFLAIPILIRDGSLWVIRRNREFILTAARSVGLCGEHNIQRIAGSILLSFCAFIGILVTFAILLVTFQSMFDNTAEYNVLDLLPFTAEELMAIDLATAVVVFPLLLLDVIGLTHITRFFDPETMSKTKKYILALIFGAGTLATVFFLGLTGLLRSEAIQEMGSHEVAAGEIDSGLADLYVPKEDEASATIADAPVRQEIEPETEETSYSFSDEYNCYLKFIMVGTPIISSVAAGPAFIGALPMTAMIATGLLFILIVIPFGIVYLIGNALVTLVNNIYAWILNLFEVFIRLGETLRQLIPLRQNNGVASNATTVRSSADQSQGSGNHQTLLRTGDNNSDTVDNAKTQQIYHEDPPAYQADSVSWNPLV